MDDSKKTGFCMYCGSNFQTKDEVQRILVQHSGSVELNRKNEVDNLLIRAEEKAISLIANNCISAPDFQEQCLVVDANYIEKILDIDAKNQKAINIRNRMISERNKRNEIERIQIEDKNKRMQEKSLRVESARKKKNAITTIGVCVVILLVALPIVSIFRDIYHTVNFWTIIISIFISASIVSAILKSIAHKLGK